jgi:hypothetical protein
MENYLENHTVLNDIDNSFTDNSVDSLSLCLTITDPEVMAAISDYSGVARSEFVSTCLKIGVLSLRSAKGVIDGEAVRNASDHLLNQLDDRLNGYRNTLEDRINSTLKHYFDPSSGLFQVRVENLTKEDGELSQIVQTEVKALRQTLDQTMDRFLGENSSFLALLEPSESNRLLASIHQTVNLVTQSESKAIVAQFSLDDPNSALSRLVRELTENHGSVTNALRNQIGEVVLEFSLDNPNGALSRLVGRVESAHRTISEEFSLDNDLSALSRMRKGIQGQLDALNNSQNEFHREVLGLISAMNSRKEAQSKSTIHGTLFEEAVGEQLHLLCAPAGEIMSPCGNTTGVVRNSKVGDYVVILPPDSVAAGARIVVEAKESTAYTMASTLEEAQEARRNRDASICLFVHSAKTAPKGLEPLSKIGEDIVVVWDSDDRSTDVIFRAGYMLAKALSVRSALLSKSDTASFQKIDKAIEAIRKQLGGFVELKTTSETIQNSATKILKRVEIMSIDLERQIDILFEQFVNIKGANNT